MYRTMPCTHEFPKADGVRQAQYSADEVFYPVDQTDNKGPGQRGRGWRLEHGTGIVTVFAYLKKYNLQALEKRQGTGKLEDLLGCKARRFTSYLDLRTREKLRKEVQGTPTAPYLQSYDVRKLPDPAGPFYNHELSRR